VHGMRLLQPLWLHFDRSQNWFRVLAFLHYGRSRPRVQMRGLARRMAAIYRARGLLGGSAFVVRTCVYLAQVTDLYGAYWARRIAPQGFVLEGRRYPYFCHSYNKTWFNERPSRWRLPWRRSRAPPAGFWRSATFSATTAPLPMRS